MPEYFFMNLSKKKKLLLFLGINYLSKANIEIIVMLFGIKLSGMKIFLGIMITMIDND